MGNIYSLDIPNESQQSLRCHVSVCSRRPPMSLSLLRYEEEVGLNYPFPKNLRPDEPTYFSILMKILFVFLEAEAHDVCT